MRLLYATAAASSLLVTSSYAQDAGLPAGTYTLDKSHASLNFTVSHMGFSDYTAGFDRFDVTLVLDPANPKAAKVTATIDPLSLDIPTPPDGFVKTLTTDAKWLNVGAYPAITYTSDSVEMTGAQTADIHGMLTMLGVSKPVVLHATFNGGYTSHPMDPNARIGFSANGTFNRSDFGMSYGIPAPGTTMGVGDAVTVTIEAEFSGPPAAAGKQ